MESSRNLRFAARQFWRNPGFTATVMITLALAIGANTAIFSMVNALMLKSLPYSHPERMGTIYTRIIGSSASDERHGLDGEQWELLRDNVPALISAVSSRGTSGANLKWRSQVQYLRAGRISANYLDVLAIQPMIGRNFSPDEDRRHGPKAARAREGERTSRPSIGYARVLPGRKPMPKSTAHGLSAPNAMNQRTTPACK